METQNDDVIESAPAAMPEVVVTVETSNDAPTPPAPEPVKEKTPEELAADLRTFMSQNEVAEMDAKRRASPSLATGAEWLRTQLPPDAQLEGEGVRDKLNRVCDWVAANDPAAFEGRRALVRPYLIELAFPKK